jgi:hypothetical protein
LSLEPAAHIDPFQRRRWGYIRAGPGALVQEQQFATLPLLQAVQFGPLRTVPGRISCWLLPIGRLRPRRSLDTFQRGVAFPVQLLKLPETARRRAGQCARGQEQARDDRRYLPGSRSGTVPAETHRSPEDGQLRKVVQQRRVTV